MKLSDAIPMALHASVLASAFACGLGATSTDTPHVPRRPRGLVGAVLSLHVAMPVVAVLLAVVFRLEAPVALGLIAVSLSPVSPWFPRSAVMARAPGYAVGVLTLAAAVSVLMLPAAAAVVDRLLGDGVTRSLAPVGKIVLVAILCPLVAGLVLRQIAPRVAERIEAPAALLASALLLVGALALGASSWHRLGVLVGDGSLIAMAIFVLAGLACGHVLAGGDDERVVLALASAGRHPAVAITLGAAAAERHLLSATLLLYLIVSAVASGGYLAWRARAADAVAAPRGRVIRTKLSLRPSRRVRW